MKDLKKVFNLLTIGSIFMDIVMVLFGVILMLKPSVALDSALKLVGMVLISSGLYSLIKYIASSYKIFLFELIGGILSIVLGILAIIKPFEIVSLIVILVGIWLLISSIVKFAFAIEFRKLKNNSWRFDLVVAFLIFVLSILLLINPFNGYIILSTYAAIMIIIYSSMDIIEQLFIRRRLNEIVKIFKK